MLGRVIGSELMGHEMVPWRDSSGLSATVE
jgi:hypothetical protein